MLGSVEPPEDSSSSCESLAEYGLGDRVVPPRPPTPEQSMRFAFAYPDSITSASFHAAVFVALVVVLVAIQWLLEKKRR